MRAKQLPDLRAVRVTVPKGWRPSAATLYSLAFAPEAYMSLIGSEQDDPEVLKAEDEAILAADNPPEHQITALDQLAEILNDDKTPVRPEDAG